MFFSHSNSSRGEHGKHPKTRHIDIPNSSHPVTLLPCSACGGSDFRQRPTGETVCTQCHSEPPKPGQGGVLEEETL